MKILLAAVIAIAIQEIAGHGMMLDPPGRSSMWRFDNKSSPINWNDHELYCGGIGQQWQVNGGRCGVCGDNWAHPHPQENENTGKYGRGKIAAQYTAGQVVDVYVHLSANHLGRFNFSLCEILDDTKPESGEECFKILQLDDGNYEYKVISSVFEHYIKVRLPQNYRCRHCVLRWAYHGGNNWGQCENGDFGMGCGPQENFRSCADVTIS